MNEVFIIAVCCSFWLIARKVKIPTKKYKQFEFQLYQLASTAQTTVKAIKALSKAMNHIHDSLSYYKGFNKHE